MQRFNQRLAFSDQITHQIIQLLTKIDSYNAQFKTQTKLSPQLIDRLQQSVLITSTGASTRIEGSKLSDEAVRDLLGKLRIKKFKTRDEQEVAGYLELLKDVFGAWDKIVFSENTIKHFHGLLLKYSEKDRGHKGEYKKDSNRVEARDAQGNLVGIIFDPTPPYLVAKEMQELVTWAKDMFEKKEKHPLLIIANFIFEFLAIHPFSDGNGRSSRILTNLLLLQNGYSFAPFVSHEKIIEDNKVEYYLALTQTQRTWKTENEDLTEWIIFFLQAILKQVNKAVELIDLEEVEDYLSEKQSLVWQAILAKENISRGEIVKETNLPISTVQQAISKLLNMKKISAIGQGRATRYTSLINKANGF